MAPLLLFVPADAAAGEQLTLCQQVKQPAEQLRSRGPRLKLGKEQVYYPDWLFGEWRITASMKGADGVLSAAAPPLAAASLQQVPGEAKADFADSMRWRFYSTLPDTLSNSFRMNVGQMPEDAIVADRAFNTAQLITANHRSGEVLESSYDPRDSPDRQHLQLAAPGGRIQQQAVDLSLTSLQGAPDEADANSFCTIEGYRQQTSNGSDIAYEVLTFYRQLAPGYVVAQQREVYFRQPPSLLPTFSSDQPAAVYSYELDMRREPPPADAQGAAACVETPKGFTQCL